MLNLLQALTCKGLHLAAQAAESVSLLGQLFAVLQLVISLRRIHREDHAHLDLSGEVVAVIIIGQRAEVQPLDEGVELAGGVAQVNGRADQQHVRGKDAIQQRAQVVLPEALAALSVLALAEQTLSFFFSCTSLT